MIETYIIILVIINSLIYFFHNKLKILGVPVDIPDKKRKFHVGTVFISGGIIFFVNIISIIFFTLLEDSLYFSYTEKINKIFFFSLIFFVFGFIDDKFDLNPWLKFISLTFFLIIILYFEDSLQIRELRFSFTNYVLNLGNYSIFITLLCYLLFINSFNMFDGINLQSSIFSSSFILYFLLIEFLVEFNFLILPALTLFIILNYKNKSFLGDGGCYLLSFIFGSFAIFAYNIRLIPFCDYIFILMMLPGFDMLRLFFIRTLKKKSPFKPDRNHIHHLILKNLNYNKTIFIISGLIIFNLTLLALKIDTKLILIIFLTLYFYLIIRFRN